MKSVVRPELPTAAAGPSQAPAAAVDNSAPRSTHPEPTYKSGKTVQRTGTTSFFIRSPLGNSCIKALRVQTCGILLAILTMTLIRWDGSRTVEAQRDCDAATH
jgi:hypothetical protein